MTAWASRRLSRARARILSGAGVAVIAAIVLTGCVAARSTGSSQPPRSASPSARSVAATLRPRAVPVVDTLTAAELACGRTLPAVTFRRESNEVALRRTEASVQFDISNVAASPDGHATVVGARLSAVTGVAADQDLGAAFSGTVTAALIRSGKVVATSTSAIAGGTTRSQETSLIEITLTARSCNGGSALPNGSYSLVVAGPSVRYLGESVPVADGVQGVRLERGVLIGNITSAPDGPWRGSGVPTCGTPVSASALRTFAQKDAAERTAIGLRPEIVGFVPHANGRGWSFSVRVRNTSRSPIVLEQGDPSSVPGGASTAVVAGGRIVSAPDAVDFGVVRPERVVLAPGASMTTAADAPAAGCTLSADHTVLGPRLPDTGHLAYLDLGLVTSTGIGVALLQRYDFKGKDGRPELTE